MRQFRFGANVADGDASMKHLLGGKGANLAEMCRIGLPVPPGFTLPTDLCAAVLAEGCLPDAVERLIDSGVSFLEEQTGRRFGDPARPLLLSVRSGARVSMPGMMDTVLNLGLTPQIVERWASEEDDARLVFDAYRRFLHMYANVVLGLCKEDSDPFERAITSLRKRRGADSDLDLSREDLEALCATYRDLVETAAPGRLPSSPRDQLARAVEAVFLSWNTPRAHAYRQLHAIPGDWGTAANVQAMVFGDRTDRSATGVCFTRDPSTGAPGLVGEALQSAQGEDVVAGIRTPLSLADDGPESFAALFPAALDELRAGGERLEAHFGDMQDIEFTVEQGKLWFLQTRTGKRTARAAVRIAVDLAGEGRLTHDEALMRVEPKRLGALLHPVVSPSSADAATSAGRLLTSGLAASPGTGIGIVALTSSAAVAAAERGEHVVLVRSETSADDVPGIAAADAVVTARGGMTSHAAVVARGMGRPTVVGCDDLEVDLEAGVIRASGTEVRAGDVVTVDGVLGRVFLGELETELPTHDKELDVLLDWADARRRLGVRANADTPEAALDAQRFGAEGIGLCRTEHMFFAPERLVVMREMILADDDESRGRALEKLRPMQQADFEQLFEAMAGHPVAIRLLDPPLHEFLPTTPEAIAEVAADLGVDAEIVSERARHHHEQNPMLGHRGCRLAVTFPAIARMQARAILDAAGAVNARGTSFELEIMIPLVADAAELKLLRGLILDVAEEVREATGGCPTFSIGAMLELPRACLRAGDLAQHADFFSFGTNDLTQTSFGLSRDDAGRFLPEYVERGLLPADPFVTLDRLGVGELITIAIDRARRARSTVRLGLCGEHGGDAESIRFCHEQGLNYVSCSPYRLLSARLAAAQAAVVGEEPPPTRARSSSTHAPTAPPPEEAR